MYINGRNAVLEAIRSGESIEKIYLQYGLPPEGTEDLRREARGARIPVTQLDRGKFRDLERRARLGTRSQGVIARIDPVDYVDIQHLIASTWEKGEIPIIAVLDRITDPHNLGAIIRSAECAGLHGVVIPRKGGGGVTDVVVKTSAGAVHSLPMARVERLVDLLRDLKGSGLRVVACAESGSVEYDRSDLSGPIALLLGSEGEGIAPELLAECDQVISIPMAGSIGSLNVSVAAGVIFFEALRQRRELERSMQTETGPR